MSNPRKKVRKHLIFTSNLTNYFGITAQEESLAKSKKFCWDS